MMELKVIADKFKNWTVTGNVSKKLRMVSKTMDNKNEIPEIIDFVCVLAPGKKWHIEIEEFEIEIKFKEKAKYNKMYTSGCFDIFHYGHLNILTQSKELCDYLIVGVSTDELIEKEKGIKPVIPFEERVKVVQAIGFVDEVVPQEDKNKQKIVDKYNIDAISVGDDWRGRYPKVSCAMEYFPYTANVSSTILKEGLKLTEK